MKLLISFMVLIAMTNSFAQGAYPAQGTPHPTEVKKQVFDPKRDAQKDIDVAIKKAKKENKRILLDVGGDWCIWCRRLDALMHSDKEITGTLKKRFIIVKVNFSQENENKVVLAQFPKITGYPHIFVLEKDGTLLHSQDTGLLESGDHHDPAKVMEFLKKWMIKDTQQIFSK